MKRRMMTGLLALAVIAGGEAGAAVVYVKVAKGQVRSGREAASALVTEVPQGTALTVLNKDGLRYEIQLADGRKGFISKLSVSESKPSTGGGLGTVKGLQDDRAVTERGTAMSARGLSEAAEKSAKDRGVSPAAIESVKQMEQLGAGVKAADVAAFRREGGLDR